MTIQNLGTSLTSDNQSEVEGSGSFCKRVFTKEYVEMQISMIALGIIVFAIPSIVTYAMYLQNAMDGNVVKKVTMITGSIGAGFIVVPFLAQLFCVCIYGCKNRSDTAPLLEAGAPRRYDAVRVDID